jgi:hypothetical protein
LPTGERVLRAKQCRSAIIDNRWKRADVDSQRRAAS